MRGMANLHETVAERLGKAGQRYTPTRKAIVELLGDGARPLLLAEVLTGGQGHLAQSSVYRNMVLLEEAGVVRRVIGTDEFARYELAEELSSHHHHLICSQCGKVEDFALPVQVEKNIESVLADTAIRNGFHDVHHRLDLVGRCAGCA